MDPPKVRPYGSCLISRNTKLSTDTPLLPTAIDVVKFTEVRAPRASQRRLSSLAGARI